MTEKPALPVFNEVFGDLLRPAPQPAPEPLTTGEEAHAKLKRNLLKALDCHDEVLSEPPTNQQEKRLRAEVATATVKAALTTDKTALKARQDNVLEVVFLRILFHRKRLGGVLTREETERLKTVPRAKLEAALGPRQLAEYDRMEF